LSEYEVILDMFLNLNVAEIFHEYRIRD